MICGSTIGWALAPGAPEEGTVQGTIKHYDEVGRTGVLLTDDRMEVSIDDRSLADPAIAQLRIGQRVHFELERTDDGAAVARGLHLVTF